MWIFAEVINSQNEVLARAEAEVLADGDLATLVHSVTDRFRAQNPDQSLLADIGAEGVTVRIGH